ncbi:MAG: hypothetical protein K9H48_15080 [Melioribacteraceae bacterium]|nr:hypothetical protein [Saprospiraceae bacterium]MCF8355774.1 hypothetical protein [Melioribacteraceae bacterium]MCF8394802.1 hypothetical protein [Melioribacteraceae bacterium]
MEIWNVGKMEIWKYGMLERWNVGKRTDWNGGSDGVNDEAFHGSGMVECLKDGIAEKW